MNDNKVDLILLYKVPMLPLVLLSWLLGFILGNIASGLRKGYKDGEEW